MVYKVLLDHLHSTADRIADYLREDRGIRQIHAEDSIDAELAYRPTLKGISEDKYIIAVEVQEGADTTFLDSVVLDCVTKARPIKLFIAYPEPQPAVPITLVERAHNKGIGVIELRSTGAVLIREALPLSLLGYRLDRHRFPKKFRERLLEADNTFRDGSPSKGCSIIYEEIEGASRRIIKKTKKKKMWRKLKPGEKASKLDLDTGAWEKVIELFQSFYIVNKKRVPGLTANLIHRVAAVTSYRNDSAHPKSLKDRVRRDLELRTRFESAIDLLFDLVNIETTLK